MAQADATDHTSTEPMTMTRSRTQSSGESTLMTDQGKTTIANGVVSKVAGIAASEIEGVYQLVSAGPGAALSNLAQRVAGSDVRDRGVTVEVGQREAAVDVRLITIYGASIPQVSQAVRQNIITRVRDMTGLVVKEVNIDVIDLYFPGEERQPAPPAPTPTSRVQ
ncbi:MAG: Asp23/Gls24 family envelope stress response protein [Herpetosiphon sp.]